MLFRSERSIYKKTNYIVTAGGGAPLYPVTRDNPYRQIRKNVHHYTMLTKDNDTYMLKAVDIDGNIIDTVSTSLESIVKNKEK